MIPLETIAYRAPLSLQFTDSVGGATVADGLVVTAWPAGDPGGARLAVQSPISTIMGFGLLPGLAGYEESRTGGPGAFSWPPAGPGRPFEVRVADPSGRYLPELIAIAVPQPDLVPLNLYSARSRPAPSGFATVCGEVRSAAGAEPAAWAIVTIEALTDTYVTMADQLGRYVVYFPYPEALPALGGSPPGGPPGRLTWPLTVSVCYQPSAQAQLADAAPGDPPELRSLLSQHVAAIVTGGTATLAFGTPLPLKLEVAPA